MADPHAPLRAALRDRDLPAFVVDLDAVEANARTLLQRCALPLRPASKSLRVPAVLHHLHGFDPRLRGVMAWSAHEATLLADAGLDDLLLGYPVATPPDARRLCALAARGVRVWSMADDPAHGALLADAAQAVGAAPSVCLDLDASLRVAGQHLGVRRSPVRDADGALRLARALRAHGLQVRGVMAYEAQVAGLPDRVPGAPWTGWAHRAIKAASIPRVAALRRQAVAALREAGFAIELVNGGGSGSVGSTGVDPTVTEVTVGSGLFAPRLFDGYDDLPLRPAALIALPVARRSDADHVTCALGGWIASGPPGRSRTPEVLSPPGLAPLPMEGWGEVQTPLRGPGAAGLQIGDVVLARHAKSGEPAEHFATALLIRGGSIVEEVPTLRGLGLRAG